MPGIISLKRKNSSNLVKTLLGPPEYSSSLRVVCHQNQSQNFVANRRSKLVQSSCQKLNFNEAILLNLVVLIKGFISSEPIINFVDISFMFFSYVTKHLWILIVVM